jgi:Endonuclease NucS
MSDEVRLWRVGTGESLSEISRASLDLEARLQEWLAGDISMLDPGLLVIGREVETDFGGFIDLLCLDAAGDVVVVELKRDKTPREITAQALDYGSWVVDLSNERITSIAEAFLGEGGFEDAFRRRFGADIPETLNGDHSMLIVGSRIDASSERIINYLSDTHGVNINAATFQYFRESDGSELVSRVFLIEPSQVELHSRTKGSSKRRPRLTYEELEMLAEEAGVAELYGQAVASFEPLLKKHTTRTTIGFAGLFEGSRKNVISLLPGQSSATEGLRYQLYKNRFSALAGLSEEALVGAMPVQRDYWTYEEGGGPDWEGYQGFIVSREEIDRLSAALTVH